MEERYPFFVPEPNKEKVAGDLEMAKNRLKRF